ncbi:hypothetical protein DTO013E5_5150 [Penicillium roqueforti]|uniref:Genomic scaffold, ProqFM164S01 n=1 Tax=Penicillium roqueforti (strain FM164) TaxID=1365484 RepID=W6Q0M8_PENRF|nr:hypothetical protein DTO012A1_4291 [Penicillium roqueforti]CDM29521.1 unnamed protein product [Penicillium roqueforti FM164]KAI2750273.1 hypothetical protein DTO013F2_4736 [Penicillium roqueforti]KAI2773029.1 hypothetical protein DTO012A8_2238 [Penicillium roqueforti]KAI3077527.1 hypothetical protein CBS147339_4553 [Penicillium roqueforti]
MRFNIAALSALLALTASAHPIAVADDNYIEETVWQTVYETVYQTGSTVSVATAVAVEEVASASSTSVVAYSTLTPVISTVTSVPVSVPTSTSIYASSTASASTATATATGSGVTIVNNLEDTVYLWVVTEDPGEMQTVAPGESFSDTWLTNSNGGGISIKMSTTEVCDDVLQFEYTQSGDILFWDLSSINLVKTSTFVTAGFGVTISDESCTTATCAAGDADCVESYQQPDDVNTLACSLDAAYTLTLG